MLSGSARTAPKEGDEQYPTCTHLSGLYSRRGLNILPAAFYTEAEPAIRAYASSAVIFSPIQAISSLDAPISLQRTASTLQEYWDCRPENYNGKLNKVHLLL
jgi:hypothetical protein